MHILIHSDIMVQCMNLFFVETVTTFKNVGAAPGLLMRLKLLALRHVLHSVIK